MSAVSSVSVLRLCRHSTLSVVRPPGKHAAPLIRNPRPFSTSSDTDITSTSTDKNPASNAATSNKKSSKKKKQSAQPAPVSDPPGSSPAHLAQYDPDDVPVRVKWRASVYCPEQNRYTEKDKVEPMRKNAVMWRKYMGIDDKLSPIFRACHVKDDEVLSEEVGWREMPRIKGRS